MARPKQKLHEKLNAVERAVAFVAAFVLAAASVGVLYLPMHHGTRETGPNGELVKQIDTQATESAYPLALLLAGIGLFVFGLNGKRIGKFTFAGVGAEGHTEEGESLARSLNSRNRRRREVQSVDLSEVPLPEPENEPVDVVKTGGERYAVYSFEDVPARVLTDAIAALPQDKQPTPETRKEAFEFAARRRGRGNHAWTVKFRECEPVAVHYGRRRRSPTSEQASVVATGGLLEPSEQPRDP